VPAPVHLGPSFSTLRALARAQATAARDSQECWRTRRFSRGSCFVEISVERRHDERGAPKALVVVREVTALVEVEQRFAALQHHVARQEGMRKVGELSAGVAHDLQNLLSALGCRLTAFELTHAMSDADAASIEAIHRIIGSGNALVAKLHAAAHPAAPAPTSVDLAGIVASAIEIAESTLHAGPRSDDPIAVHVAFPPLPPVWGSVDGLRNMFVNLLLNARDAMPSGGAVWLSAEAFADGVVVRVEDEGSGISPAHLEQIFEPFFTTKQREGTGLGLALARQIMEQAGGNIMAKNRTAGGACFELRFALPPACSPSEPADDLDPSRRGFSAGDP